MTKRRITLFATTVAVITMAAVALVLSSSVALGQTTTAGPDVQLKILGASIPSDLKPVVTFSLTDSKGAPLRLADIDEGGLRFLIGAVQADPDSKGTRYVNYVVNSNVTGREYKFEGQTVKPVMPSATQATVDNGGTFADLGGGKFSYTFKTAAPADFDVNATHTIGGYATRGARAFVSNATFDFVPAGGPIQLQREVVQTQACNACHVNLAAHGGTRRETGVCVLCHTSQTTDPETGNTVDFKVMIHKIHTGAHLPSVEAGNPYVIVGYSQNVFDFSGIRWPQDTRNCQTCHQGAQAANFMNAPSAQACGSCHDGVNFQTGQGHLGGPQPTNANCATCHQAEGPEFGPSVAGAHTIPEKSQQLRGINFQIVSFTDTKPGQSPTVVFNIKDKAEQPIAPSEMASLSLVLAGPTIDYSNAVSETATGATPTGDGNFSYTFKAKIPENAAGTYAVGIQGYLSAELKNPFGQVVKNADGSTQIRDVGFNRVAYGAVTDSVPMPRKQIVDLNNCNKCHETLALHGGTRRNTEFCVACHNPNATDIGKRTTAKGPMPPESVTFDKLIHKIHTGEELTEKPYTIYGGSPSSPGPLDMSEARFPTDRRNCTVCHVPNSNLLAFTRQGLLPTTVKVGDTVVSSTPPLQTACMSCHDSQAAKAHANSMTASGGQEACLVCHNENREFAVSKAHAR